CMHENRIGELFRAREFHTKTTPLSFLMRKTHLSTHAASLLAPCRSFPTSVGVARERGETDPLSRTLTAAHVRPLVRELRVSHAVTSPAGVKLTVCRVGDASHQDSASLYFYRDDTRLTYRQNCQSPPEETWIKYPKTGAVRKGGHVPPVTSRFAVRKGRESSSRISVSGVRRLQENAVSRDDAILADPGDRMLTARSGPLGLGVPRTLGPAEGSDHLFLLPERALGMDSTHLRQDLAGLDFNLHLNLLHTAPRGNVWLCELSNGVDLCGKRERMNEDTLAYEDFIKKSWLYVSNITLTVCPHALDSIAKIYEIIRDVFSFGAPRVPSNYSDDILLQSRLVPRSRLMGCGLNAVCDKRRKCVTEKHSPIKNSIVWLNASRASDCQREIQVDKTVFRGLADFVCQTNFSEQRAYPEIRRLCAPARDQRIDSYHDSLSQGKDRSRIKVYQGNLDSARYIGYRTTELHYEKKIEESSLAKSCRVMPIQSIPSTVMFPLKSAKLGISFLPSPLLSRMVFAKWPCPEIHTPVMSLHPFTTTFSHTRYRMKYCYLNKDTNIKKNKNCRSSNIFILSISCIMFRILMKCSFNSAYSLFVFTSAPTRATCVTAVKVEGYLYLHSKRYILQRQIQIRHQTYISKILHIPRLLRDPPRDCLTLHGTRFARRASVGIIQVFSRGDVCLSVKSPVNREHQVRVVRAAECFVVSSALLCAPCGMQRGLLATKPSCQTRIARISTRDIAAAVSTCVDTDGQDPDDMGAGKMNREIPSSTLATLRGILVSSLSRENLGPHDLPIHEHTRQRSARKVHFHEGKPEVETIFR
ncbi:hypothetical protein ALC62_15203, partial [Cyphomyrmex costatus]